CPSARALIDQLPDPLTFFPAVRWARIVIPGRLYPNINETDVLDWPPRGWKSRGGKRGGRGFDPAKGDQGPVLGRRLHHNERCEIFFLGVKGFIVPIGSDGLAFPNEPPKKK